MPLRSFARKPLPKPNAKSDPRYLRVIGQLNVKAAHTKAHPPAAKKAADAAGASKGPPNERMATGKSKQVDKIQDAKTEKPKPTTFLEVLRAEIEKAMPKTLGDTEKFMKGGQSEELKGGLKGNVAQQKSAAAGQVASASGQQPSPAGEAKQVKPLPADPAAPPPRVPGGEAMPAPKNDADVSLQDSKQDVDDQMKEAKVNDRQLQKANDPRFSAVLDAKGAVAKQADTAPGQYRAQERGVLTGAANKANSDALKGAGVLIGVRSHAGARVLTRQQQQKLKDEAKRKEITDKIEKIYGDTKARVEKKLADLDTEVNTMFDQGVDKALGIMKEYTEDRIFEYKVDRYLSIPLVGQARWIRDQFKGLPEEANKFYEEGRRVFQATMDVLIVRVANLVELRLKEAKDEVKKGQDEIKKFVDGQPKELQQFAQQAAKDVNDRFKELESTIDDKKNELASSLAGKYKEAFDKANEELKKIQDSNKGLVQKFVEKLGEIIKILREFKERVMSMLAKARDAIDIIVDDPIGFLGNLVAAVKGGVSKFVDNIWEHLKKGFMQWLFGELPPGVEIPSDLSLPSILKLVLGILGITYEKMRAKAVKLIGERNVKIIEKVVEYITTLIKGGPAALWEKVKEDLSNLKEMVIEAIQNWLITTLIKKAIAKIVSMCNPVGAIIQAIIAIYDLVMFIVEKIQQILAFFEAIVDSIYNIAKGNITGAINWIEQALARMVPILIGFLARLIGLGGITEKIREFIFKIQSKVDKAIDKAIEKIVAFIKKLFGAGGKEKEKESSDVKGKLRADLKGKDLSNPETAKSTIDGLWAKYQPLGLKSIHIHRDAKNPETFHTFASASLEEEISSFNGKVAPPRLIEIAQQMTPYKDRTTAYVFYDGKRPYPGSPFVNRTKKGGHRQHAEMRFLEKSGLDGSGVPAIWTEVEERRKTSKKPQQQAFAGQKVDVRIQINRSPCDLCAKELSKAQKTHAKYVSLTIDMVSIYKAQGTFEPTDRTSKQALVDMMKAGIKLNPLRIWELIKKKAASSGALEFTYPGQNIRYPIDVAADEFIAQENGVKSALDEAAQEFEKQQQVEKQGKGAA